MAFKFTFADLESTETAGSVTAPSFTVTFSYECVVDTMTLDAPNNIGVVDYIFG
jgi:hypothetical protein